MSSNTISLYVARESGLHGLHPLTKLALAGLMLVGGLALPEAWMTYLFFTLIVLPLALWGRVAGRLLGSLLRIALPLTVSLLLVRGLFWPSGTPLVALGPFTLKEEGLRFTLIIVARILVVASSFLLLSLTTRPDALMITLAQRGLSGTIAYIMLTSLQIVPHFQAKARTILAAQQSRGLEIRGNMLVRIRALVPLVIPLTLGSIVDIEERAMALEARAFSLPGPKTSVLILPDPPIEKVVRWLLAIGMLGLIAVRIGWGMSR
jgi:energy-coupling factor transport system permease protein